MSIAVNDKVYSVAGGEYRINRKILTEAFRLRLGLESGSSYRVEGDFAPKLGMVAFELLKAVKTRSGK